MMLTCALMQTNHSAFGLDVDIGLIHTALHLPIPPVGPSIGLNIVVVIKVCFSIVVALSNVILTTPSRAFSAALYSKVGRLASEEVALNLICAKCLPILLYATDRGVSITLA